MCADDFTSPAVVKTRSELETKWAQSWNFPKQSTWVEPQTIEILRIHYGPFQKSLAETV